ncbi:uncharacterized protein [Procambarus clarkii]|uniref:uncharacterized protein n=1 Tax=Procambarus clarkii TaxID=6728 RepID=UPI001E6781D9|nr:uncharacterized protein LOC123760780 [Procambarus clarkii]
MENVQDHLDNLIQFLEQLNINSVSQNALTTSGANTSEPNNEVRLPAIDLPQFHGREENFECYRNMFDLFVNSKSSSNKTKKYLYLWSTLKGEAKAVIDHLIPSDDDYDTAIQLLEVNYSNHEVAISNLYYRRKAILTPTPETTAEAIQEFRLQVESLVKAFVAKADVPKTDWVLKLEIQSNFPREILASICSHYQTDILTLDEIFDGLRMTVNRMRAP